MILKYRIDVKTVSMMNARMHPIKRTRLIKRQRKAARESTLLAMQEWGPPSPPIFIILQRLCGRKMDTDNLAAALKAVRDGIADALEIDDGDARINWVYTQTNGKPVGVVRVEIDDIVQMVGQQ